MTEVETSPVILAQFSIASIAGNERAAMDKVARVVAAAGLSIQSLERLQTAVSEATMNAIEHGNRGAPDLPVRVQVQALPKSIVVRVTDYGGGTTAGAEPNLDAKLAGEQSPRGWGLFLIQSMVDEVRFEDSSQSHTVEMVMRRDKKSSPETDSPQVRVRIDGESAIADLSGDIDGEAAAAMEGAYELTGSSGPIVLNFSQVGYINSAGIAWVIGLMRRALADGRPVAAFGLTPHYEEMFSITRLSEFIAVHTDEASALAAAH